MTRRRLLIAVVASTAILFSAPGWSPVRAATDTLPDRLSDEQFWALSQTLSEPDGDFRSDNLVSNEIYFQSQLPALAARARQGGVYLGVGPEQNFTYIAALRSQMAFITDIRRGNLHTQLMYKALFELSADRAEFVSRLFSKPRSPTLTKDSTALEIMDANYVDTSGTAVFEKNAQDIIELLTVRHALPLSQADRTAIIQGVYYNFYWFGPQLNYNSSANSNRGNFVSFHDLMVSTDNAGVERSFLANEGHFQFLKELHARNLIVPVVGDLAGPKMVRAVGAYIRDHDATVTAYYLSNVEQYLNQDGKWRRFCANIATMPLDEQSTFIRSGQTRGGGRGGGGLMNTLGSMLTETRACGAPAG